MASSELPAIGLGLEGWRLRAWRTGDAPALARHANNVNVWRWMSDGFPHPYTLEIAEHWVGPGHIDFGGDNWAIACDDEAVGGCGITLEGIQRKSAYKAGRVIDRHVFSIVRSP